MKKYISLLFSILLFCSCIEEGDVKSYYGTNETAEKIGLYMSTNIKSANNMSDEEMEDVIVSLHNSAVKIYCTEKPKKNKLPNERVFKLMMY